MSNDTKRPKNPSANVLPTEGYVLEIDGKFKSEYGTSEEALKAGLELKKKYPHIQVNVYDAKDQTRTRVELPAQSDRKTAQNYGSFVALALGFILIKSVHTA